MTDPTPTPDPEPATNPGPLANPGPHPHEAADVKAWGGADPSLPEGVEPYTGPEDGPGSEGSQETV